MTEGFRGQCLCGAVAFESSSKPMFQANCHCDDCRRSGGSVYASFAFVDETNLKISGDTKTYESRSDAGNTMTRQFCPTCGSHVYHSNSKAPSRLGITPPCILCMRRALASQLWSLVLWFLHLGNRRTENRRPEDRS